MVIEPFAFAVIVDESAFTVLLAILSPAVRPTVLLLISTDSSAEIEPPAFAVTLDASTLTVLPVMSSPAVRLMSEFFTASICAMSIMPPAVTVASAWLAFS